MITYKYNFLLLICDMIVQTWTLSNTLPPKTQCYQILHVDIWYDHSGMILIKTLPHKMQCYTNLHGFTLYDFWFTAKIEMSCMHRHNMINHQHLSAKSFVTQIALICYRPYGALSRRGTGQPTTPTPTYIQSFEVLSKQSLNMTSSMVNSHRFSSSSSSLPADPTDEEITPAHLSLTSSSVSTMSQQTSGNGHSNPQWLEG